MFQGVAAWARRRFRATFPHRTKDIGDMAALCQRYQDVILTPTSCVRETITDRGEDTIRSILFFFAEIQGVSRTGERIVFTRETARLPFVTHWAGGDDRLFQQKKDEATYEARACLAQIRAIIASASHRS